MKTIKITDQEYEMLIRVSRKRNRSVKSMLLKMFSDLDYQDSKGSKDVFKQKNTGKTY